MTDLAVRLSEPAARALTATIRAGLDNLVDLAALLLQARETEAWSVLGYKSWDAYVGAEFGKSRGAAYRLITQAKVTNALVSGGKPRARDPKALPGPPVSARQAAILAPVLAEATVEINELIADGVPEKVAVATVTAAHQRPKAPGGVVPAGSSPRPTPSGQASERTAPPPVRSDARSAASAVIAAMEAAAPGVAGPAMTTTEAAFLRSWSQTALDARRSPAPALARREVTPVPKAKR